MKRLRIILGLALIPLCALLGSFVSIGAGNGTFIGFVLGIVLSFLVLTYGPGRKMTRLPTSYYLNHYHQANNGVNQQAVDVNTLRAREAEPPPWSP